MPIAESSAIDVSDLQLLDVDGSRRRLAGPGVRVVVLMRHRH